jgi:3-polyprenyl-4-hydroxybenzoate decarboxylase
VWSIPEAAGWGHHRRIDQADVCRSRFAVMALAAQCTAGAYFGKYVIVVDDDIDPTNVHQVLWAMATRSRPSQSIDILRETWSTFLDPSLNPPEIRPWGSKCLINACMDTGSSRHSHRALSFRRKPAKGGFTLAGIGIERTSARHLGLRRRERTAKSIECERRLFAGVLGVAPNNIF